MLGKYVHFAVAVAAIGAINWGLVGAVDKNLVQMLADAVQVAHLAKVIYVAVGLAGVFALLHAVEQIAAGK